MTALRLFLGNLQPLPAPDQLSDHHPARMAQQGRDPAVAAAPAALYSSNRSSTAPDRAEPSRFRPAIGYFRMDVVYNPEIREIGGEPRKRK